MVTRGRFSENITMQVVVCKSNAKTELLSRVYFAQKADSLPGDYCRLVAADQEQFQICLSEEEVRNMSSRLYKKYIKEKVNKSAFAHLISVQQNHSKIRSIKYSKFDMQPYMKSDLFSKDDITLLFSLRSRTVRGIKNDFSEQFKPNLSCPLCMKHLDSLPEVLNCSKLQTEVQSLPEETQQLITHTKYEDI